MKKLNRVMGVAMVVLAAGIANAESPAMKTTETKTTSVYFVRSQAQTTEGAKALYAKLRAAARQVCGESRGVGDRDHLYCVTAALGEAVQEANVPAVSLLHGNRGTVEVLASR
jgi:UrcA family protein